MQRVSITHIITFPATALQDTLVVNVSMRLIRKPAILNILLILASTMPPVLAKWDHLYVNAPQDTLVNTANCNG